MYRARTGVSAEAPHELTGFQCTRHRIWFRSKEDIRWTIPSKLGTCHRGMYMNGFRLPRERKIHDHDEKNKGRCVSHAQETGRWAYAAGHPNGMNGLGAIASVNLRRSLGS